MNKEAELYNVWKRNERMNVLDIGACEGLSSREYLRLFPNVMVNMFEPRTDNCDIIRKNFVEIPKQKWLLNQCALGDVEGEVDFYVSYNADNPEDPDRIGNKSSSMLKPSRHLVDHKWCRFIKDRVRVHTLDSFGLEDADFIHIDVQGAELKVFDGGQNTLRNVQAVWMEVSKNMLYAGQPLKDKVMKYMRRCGFELKIDTCVDNYKWGDQLWVR